MKFTYNANAIANYIMQDFNNEDCDVRDLIQMLREYRNSFASEIAKTVCEKGLKSEKQAFCLAKGLIENQNVFAFRNFLQSNSDFFSVETPEYISE